jgi:hypothetical protein
MRKLMRRHCGLALVALENDETRSEAHDETCEAKMTAMRRISTLVSELTTSIAITVMICGLMIMALG